MCVERAQYYLPAISNRRSRVWHEQSVHAEKHILIMWLGCACINESYWMIVWFSDTSKISQLKGNYYVWDKSQTAYDSRTTDTIKSNRSHDYVQQPHNIYKYVSSGCMSFHRLLTYATHYACGVLNMKHTKSNRQCMLSRKVRWASHLRCGDNLIRKSFKIEIHCLFAKTQQ